MASIVYEAKQMADRLLVEVKDGKIADQTRRQYKDRVIKFAIWCRTMYGCQHVEDCPSHLQDYSDWLVAQGYSPNTVHKYLAGVSRAFDVPLEYISKPRRVVANNTHSRGVKAVDSRSDSQREASPRLYDFALAVGIRRAEYKHLRGDDLVVDESGYPCVRVRRGKGGKYQEQRIAQEDEHFVRSFFDGSKNKVFSQEEMKNKLDLTISGPCGLSGPIRTTWPVWRPTLITGRSSLRRCAAAGYACAARSGIPSVQRAITVSVATAAGWPSPTGCPSSMTGWL